MAQPNGGFEGEAKFKLRFKSGGAIDFGTAMLKAAQMGEKKIPSICNSKEKKNNFNLIFSIKASRNYVQDAPPPYTPPSGNWYAAPPPAYTASPEGYGGW